MTKYDEELKKILEELILKWFPEEVECINKYGFQEAITRLKSLFKERAKNKTKIIEYPTKKSECLILDGINFNEYDFQGCISCDPNHHKCKIKRIVIEET